MKRITFIYLFFSLLLSYSDFVLAQSTAENWLTLLNKNEKVLSINTYGLESFQSDDFYLWVKEELTAPINVEGVEKEVHQTRTYYLFNKSLQRYSIVEIIYYDNIGNVLADYKYPNNSTVPEYRYNYPIFPQSEMEIIFKKCEEFLTKG